MPGAGRRFAVHGIVIVGVGVGGWRIAGGKRVFDRLIESSFPDRAFFLGSVLMARRVWRHKCARLDCSVGLLSEFARSFPPTATEFHADKRPTSRVGLPGRQTARHAGLSSSASRIGGRHLRAPRHHNPADKLLNGIAVLIACLAGDGDDPAIRT